MQCNDNAWCFLTKEVNYQFNQQLKHKHGISEVKVKKINFLFVEFKKKKIIQNIYKNIYKKFFVKSCNITVHCDMAGYCYVLLKHLQKQTEPH